ncbi:uncharacterized protein LOC132177168 [Corylus avellana]|uniref:uncharacterized protein LOC132177168 n=1 Tax=Corylus avellana TaxID=13451 RepID=UPI00286CEBE9|nr:uncharacterized protein LOC132177168 [Corylus avellana]
MWVHPSLSNFRFTVGHHVKRIMSRLPRDVEFELERWERCLNYINGVAVPSEIHKVLQYSTAFFLERHAIVKKLSNFGIGNMRQLKCCVVGECNEVEVIIDEPEAQKEGSEADARKEYYEANAHEEEADAHEEDDEVEAHREDGCNGIVSKTSGAKKIVLGSLEYLMGGASTTKVFISSDILDIVHMSPIDHYFHNRGKDGNGCWIEEKRRERGGGNSTASFTLGFMFSPTEEQLIDHYLRLKNEGKLSVIKSDKREWFFFRRLDDQRDAGVLLPSIPHSKIGSNLASKLMTIRTKILWIYIIGEPIPIVGEPPRRATGKAQDQRGVSWPKSLPSLPSLILPGKRLSQAKSKNECIPTGPFVKTPSSDGYNWRKYGEKGLLSGALSYYRCASRGCCAKKRHSFDHSGREIEVHYEGKHNHDIPCQGDFVLCHLFQKGWLDDIKDDKIYHSGSSLSKEAVFRWEESLPKVFDEEGTEKRITLESQGEVFDVEAFEMKSNSDEIVDENGVEFKASGPDKKFEIEEIGIEPETSDMDWKTSSMGLEIYSDTIIQRDSREILQSCLMCGGLGLTEPPKDEEWENAKKIYLMDNELSDLPKNPRCPVLSTLFLQRNYKLRTIPPSFFDHMPALQILNLSGTGIKSLPESIIRLVSLKRLFLNDCHRFMILSPKVGELEQLEVLDLEGTDIMDLPKEIKELTNLTCLEVSFCAYLSNGRRATQSDVVVPCGIISALSHLEELNMSVNPDDKRWSACVEAIVIEVCTLQRLNTLKFYFPRVELVRHFLLNSPMWVHPSLSNFRFTVGHHVKRTMSRLPHDVEFELERWERCLKYINGVDIPTEIKEVLQYSTAFFLERHATVKKLSDFGIGNMKQLKCFVVGECNEVEVIIDETDARKEDNEADANEDDDVDAWEEDDRNEIVSKTSGAIKIVLGSLEYLYIYYTKNLRRIWEGPLQPKCLSILKSMTLRTCPQLTTIFTTSLLDNLYNLEELTVEDCPSIKTLVSCKISAKPKTSDFLPNLKRISLYYMPGLVSISSGLHIAPRLELLSFYNCPNLKHLLIEEVSSKDLKKIKGEWNWWVALKWRSGRPSYLDDIFVPINI